MRHPCLIEALEHRLHLAAFDVLVFSKTAAFRHDSIPAGISMIQALGQTNDFSVVATEDANAFNDANLDRFEAVVFLLTTGDVLSAPQQSAFERYISAGGGYVGIHSAADTEYAWPFYGGLVGAYFKDHPPGTAQATIKVADKVHPATAGLPERWVRTDEWYNYQTNPRGDVHVLMTLDETTYSAGAGAMGHDHPISWVHEYQGGRAFYTGLGHTQATYGEPLFRQHILGGIRYAAGAAPADDGATVNANFSKAVIDANTNNPMQLDIAPDGKVYYVERAGAVKMWNPATSATTTIGTIPVVTTNEDGLLGIALDPAFAANRWLYLFYSPTPATANRQHVSRFTLAANGQLDMASEKVLLQIPVQRTNCCHSAGSLDFDAAGNLYIATGDNTNPFASSGYAPIDEQPGRSDWDAQKSSANTNDLRGKILRIRPTAAGSYTIPSGNLFAPGAAGARSEIYVMGNRNPFRISVDSQTGWLYWGDVGPDAQADSATRGPRGYDEINQARSAGNYGWPYFNSNNKPYIDYNFATGVSGAAFNPAAPVNNSPNNTGLTNLPAARSAWIWYPYGASPTFPEITAGSGRTAMAGPVYHFNAATAKSNALPAYYDDTLFIYEWSRNWIKEVKVDAAGNVLKINPFLPHLSFLRPMDMKIGPDGVMYIIEWGTGFGGNNADSQLVRIDYNPGDKPPIAVATADKDSGATPLIVQFSSAGTTPGDRGPLTYAWDLNGNGTIDSTSPNPAFTYHQAGNFTARLTVTDAAGVSSSTTIPIVAGNTRPTVTLTWPPDGAFFSWSSHLPYWATVTDPQDGSTAAGTIPGSRVVIQPILGHDTHGHPLAEYPGPAGSFPTEAGHGSAADDIYLGLEARYTDNGGPSGASPLTGSALLKLQPRLKQAEHFSSSSGVILLPSEANDPTAGSAVAGINDGDWVSYTPVNFQNIDQVTFFRHSPTAGGRIEMRLGSPTGQLLHTLTLQATTTGIAPQSALIPNLPAGAHELFLVFRGTGAQLGALKLSYMEFTRAQNAAPLTAAESYRLERGKTLRASAAAGVLANDTDSNADRLFPVLLTPPANGALVLYPDGSFTYTPNPGFTGADSFAYRAHDFALASPTRTVNLSVEPTNPAGDADGDRRITVNDYFAIDRGRARRLTGFANGDFDYSGGTPNADDYMLIDRAFLAQVNPAQSASPPAPLPSFGDEPLTDEDNLFDEAGNVFDA